MDVLRDVTKQRFKAYVQQAQKERDRRSAAQVLKKLVQFNALVVTPILEKVKGEEAAKKKMADMLVQAADKVCGTGPDVGDLCCCRSAFWPCGGMV